MFNGFLDNQIAKVDDEFLLYRAHISWIPVALHMIPAILVAGVLSGVVWGALDNLAAGILAALAVLLLGFLSQMPYIYEIAATDIVVTNKRFLCKKGIITIKDNRGSNLSRIDDTDIDMHTVASRIFKYGDVTVQTLGGGDDFYSFTNVARPRLLVQAINEAKDKYAPWGEASSMMGRGRPVSTPAPRESLQVALEEESPEEPPKRSARRSPARVPEEEQQRSPRRQGNSGSAPAGRGRR